MNWKGFLFVVFFLTGGVCATAQIKFQRSYGGAMFNEGRSVKQTFDGGYIIAGSTSSFGFGATDMLLIKTDGLGNGVFAKTFGGVDIDRGYDVVQLNDSGYAICGYTNSLGNGGYDGYLVRTDKNGDTLWTKTYGGTDWDFLYSIQQTSDSGFILAGETFSFGNGQNDMYLIKTNSLGDTLWTTTFGGDSSEVAYSVQQTFDGGYILTGYTKSMGAGEKDVYLIKTNSLGDSLWTKVFGGMNDEEGNCVKQTLDSGYIVGGYTASFGLAGYDDIYLVKTNSSGDTTWTRSVGSPDNKRVTFLVQRLDGGYVLVGSTTGQGNPDILFWRTDTTGDWIGSGSPGGLNEDIGYCIQKTTDGGYIIVGNTKSFGTGLLNVFLVKMDSTGSSGTYNSVNDLANNKNHIEVFPNPFSRFTTIIIHPEINQNESASFELYNVFGVEVRSKIIKNGETTFQLSREDLPAGVYTYKILSSETIIGVGKIIIQ